MVWGGPGLLAPALGCQVLAVCGSMSFAPPKVKNLVRELMGVNPRSRQNSPPRFSPPSRAVAAIVAVSVDRAVVGRCQI